MRILSKKVKALVVALLCSVALPAYSYAQVKINDFSEVESTVQSGADSFKNMALYIIGAVFAITLIFVIWEVASGKPHAKEHFIGWLIGVGIYILAMAII